MDYTFALQMGKKVFTLFRFFLPQWNFHPGKTKRVFSLIHLFSSIAEEEGRETQLGPFSV
jgi:hypothetical protein